MASRTRKTTRTTRKHLRKRIHRRKGKRTMRRHKRGGTVVNAAFQLVKRAFLPFLMYNAQKRTQKRVTRRSDSHKKRKH